MKKHFLLTLSTLLVIFAGCATPSPIDIAQIPTENRIGPKDVVAVDFEGPRPVIDPLVMYGIFGPISRLRYDTTAEWDAVFAGAKDAKWKFHLTKSVLSQHTAVIGFTFRLTYTVEGNLTDGEHSYHVTGTGSRAAAAMLIQAARQAVELAIVNTAQHCKELIAQTNQTAQNESESLMPTADGHPAVAAQRRTSSQREPPGAGKT